MKLQEKFLNFANIEERQPKAFNKLLEYWGDKTNMGKEDMIKQLPTLGKGINYRWLYDFFDGQGIHIILLYERTYPDHNPADDYYSWRIELEGSNTLQTRRIIDEYDQRTKKYTHHKNRNIAEVCAYCKAFQILESEILNPA